MQYYGSESAEQIQMSCSLTLWQGVMLMWSCVLVFLTFCNGNFLACCILHLYLCHFSVHHSQSNPHSSSASYDNICSVIVWLCHLAIPWIIIRLCVNVWLNCELKKTSAASYKGTNRSNGRTPTVSRSSHVQWLPVHFLLCIARVWFHLLPIFAEQKKLEHTGSWTSLQAVTWSLSTAVQSSRRAPTHPATPPRPHFLPLSLRTTRTFVAAGLLMHFNGKSLPRTTEASSRGALHFQHLRQFLFFSSFFFNALELVCSSS